MVETTFLWRFARVNHPNRGRPCQLARRPCTTLVYAYDDHPADPCRTASPVPCRTVRDVPRAPAGRDPRPGRGPRAGAVRAADGLGEVGGVLRGDGAAAGGRRGTDPDRLAAAGA